MMAEVIRRRFSRASRLRAETGALSLAAVGADPAFEGLADEAADAEGRDESAPPMAARDAGWALPDLVIVDGGKGQLSAAVGVLRDLDLGDVPVAGLAKRFEELYLPGRSDPIILPPKSQGLYLVQRIRDEAHRFAITYHRTVRSRRALASVFDEIEGIGPVRKKALLKRFGSLRRVREASVDELAETPGIPRELAERLKSHLAREGMLA
jgi:excinuclease ABC subunit C